MSAKYIEIMDTTLRDGEQMKNVSYSAEEKLAIARILLEELQVDRIEITSARVSLGEEKSARMILDWAKKIDKRSQVEILGFVDGNRSVDWIRSVGGFCLNLLVKGSLRHLEGQLKKTKEEHLSQILETLEYAEKHDFKVNIYLEDWSNGMRHSRDYVYYLLDHLKGTSIRRFMLPDTLGIFYPNEVRESIQDLLRRYPELHFDFHGHNDYGLGTANTLVAIEEGVSGVHLTVNGMGERAGNSSLDEVVVALNDFFPDRFCHGIQERALSKASKKVEIFSGLRLAFNKPILGENVYVQTAGLHADGDLKGGLYANLLNPDRFGKVRSYALGKLSGMASIEQNLQKLNISLSSEDKKKVLAKVIELGDKKEIITEEDLPYIISDVLETPSKRAFQIRECRIITSISMRPIAAVLVSYQGEEVEETAMGDGGYDAFVKAIRKIAEHFQIELPILEDYSVIIPPGGKTDALVQTTITWNVPENGQKSHAYSFKTKGVDSDQVLSAVEATEKMINRSLNL